MKESKIWRAISGLLIVIILVFYSGGNIQGKVIAQNAMDVTPPEVEIVGTEVVSPYYTVEHIITADGTHLDAQIIKGPSEPPAEFEAERAASILPLNTRGTLANFPSYDWVFGCSAVSGAMIAAYYDQGSLTNMYTGPTNGGVMPQTDTSWSTWSDGFVTYPNNPLVASHNGIDGRVTKGSIDDYWIKYGNTSNDPYITGAWTQHAWGNAIGDYMKTSQSAYSNTDGSTSFYNYESNSKLTCAAMVTHAVDQLDGTYGRKLFYEARGYSVTDCYNQNTDNKYPGGFSLANFQAQIDAGHPVLLNLEGHSIVGYGYAGATIYIRDTWDSNPAITYTMTWGGSYQGMELLSVSVVIPGLAAPSAPTGVAASDGTYTDKVQVSWNAASGATYYQVYRNTSNTTTGASQLTASYVASPYVDITATIGTTYYYWVKACNTVGCSGYSSSDSGWRAYTIPIAPIGVGASDGMFTDKVQVSWNVTSGATFYQVYRNISVSTAGATQLSANHAASPYDDTSCATGTLFYYWVKACNPGGCSGFSAVDPGWRAFPIPAAPTGLSASDGLFTDKVSLSWNAVSGATHYEIHRSVTNNTVGAMLLKPDQMASPYDDIAPNIGTNYYWVNACNMSGCSDYSASDSGWRALQTFLPLLLR